MKVISGARAKIERAKDHISNLDSVIHSLAIVYSASVQENTDGRTQSIKYELPQSGNVDTRIALLIGDAVHNLKTALDYAWYFCTANTPADKYAKFPVYKSSVDLEKTLRGAKIDVSMPAIFKLVMSDVKPYGGGDGDATICALHELDIIDKHRLILPVIQFTTVSGITVQDQNGVELTGPGVHQGHGCFRFDFDREVQVKDYGKPTVDVSFGEGCLVKGFDVLDTLAEFLQRTNQVVGHFESIM